MSDEVKTQLVINKLSDKRIYDYLARRGEISLNELYLIARDDSNPIVDVKYDAVNRKLYYTDDAGNDVDIITVANLLAQMQLDNVATSGSYNDLSQQPQVNGVTLVGNRTTSDLHINYNQLTNLPTIPQLTSEYSALDQSRAITGAGVASALLGTIPSSRSVTGTGALQGGGDLTQDRTISHKVAPISLTGFSAVKIATDEWGHTQIGTPITPDDIQAQPATLSFQNSIANIDARYGTVVVMTDRSETMHLSHYFPQGVNFILYWANNGTIPITCTLPYPFGSHDVVYINGQKMTEDVIWTCAPDEYFHISMSNVIYGGVDYLFVDMDSYANNIKASALRMCHPSHSLNDHDECFLEVHEVPQGSSLPASWSWSSSDENVAVCTPDGNRCRITPQGNGRATIVCTNGGLQAYTIVDVSNYDTSKTTVYRSNFSPEGTAWYNTVTNFDADGFDEIDVMIDTSTCVGNDENLLSIGDDISAMTIPQGWTVNCIYNASLHRLNVEMTNPNGNHISIPYNGIDGVCNIWVDYDGVHINDELVSGRNQTEKYVTDGFRSYITSGEMDIKVGSIAGTHSNAVYEYVQVTRDLQFPCTSLTLDASSVSCTTPKSFTIGVTALPETTTDEMEWSSSDDSVVVVDEYSGTFIPIGNGTATLTCTCGQQSASCTVSVNVANPDLFLRTLYQPSGSTFSDTLSIGTDIDFTNGEYIFAYIGKLDSNSGTQATIFSVGEDISATTRTVCFRQASDGWISVIAYTGGNGIETAYYTGTDIVCIRFASDGIYMSSDGEHYNMVDFGDSQSQFTTMWSQIVSNPSIQVGSVYGVHSRAKYNIVKVARQ